MAALPHHLRDRPCHAATMDQDALANPWVLGISALGALAEFFADKIMWLDSIWDTVHTIIRPLGGALLARPRGRRFWRPGLASHHLPARRRRSTDEPRSKGRSTRACEYQP